MRVLAVSSPIYAHAVNAAPFVEGLVARGAEVHRALPTPLAQLPAHPGVRVWDSGGVEPFRPPAGRLPEVSARYDWLLRDAATRAPGLERLVRRLRPDVVLTDSLGHAAALVAERAGVPWVSFGDGPLHHPDETTPPFGAGLPYRTARPWVWRNRVVQAASRRVLMAPAQRRYAALRAGLRLPPSPAHVLEAAISPWLHLHCGVPELEYPRRRGFPAHVRFVGLARPPLPPGWGRPAWWEQVVERRPGGVVLATQGTLRADTDELLRPTLAALVGSGRAGVLTTGGADPSRLGGPGLVGGAVAVESFVPYAEVLPHTSALVTNGGWTGVLLALAHGVPVLQVGRSEEKADIGRRVEWAGAGLHLPRPGRRALASALDRVEGDAALRSGARRVAAALARHDPAGEGAELVAALLSRGAAGPRIA